MVLQYQKRLGIGIQYQDYVAAARESQLMAEASQTSRARPVQRGTTKSLSGTELPNEKKKQKSL